MHKTLRPAAAAWARAANINDPIIGILVHLTQEAFDFSSLIHTAELCRLYDSAGVADARREEENADEYSWQFLYHKRRHAAQVARLHLRCPFSLLPRVLTVPIHSKPSFLSFLSH